MEIDTNIISDEEFLREIFDKEKETKTNHASTDIEDELTSELKENIVNNDDINKKKDPAEECGGMSSQTRHTHPVPTADSILPCRYRWSDSDQINHERSVHSNTRMGDRPRIHPFGIQAAQVACPSLQSWLSRCTSRFARW